MTYEVTNVGIGKDQLSPMAEQAREAFGAEAIEVVADKGYFNGEEIAACEDTGIAVYVPKPVTSNALTPKVATTNVTSSMTRHTIRTSALRANI